MSTDFVSPCISVAMCRPKNICVTVHSRHPNVRTVEQGMAVSYKNCISQMFPIIDVCIKTVRNIFCARIYFVHGESQMYKINCILKNRLSSTCYFNKKYECMTKYFFPFIQSLSVELTHP